MNVKDAKSISISDYLRQRGIEVKSFGTRSFCSSPFSRDTNWSFIIYPNNTFYCWSTGKGGDIIRLVQLIEGVDFKGALDHLEKGAYTTYAPNYKAVKETPVFKEEPFDYTKYLTYDPTEQSRIREYASSRSIHCGYYCGVYFTRDFKSNKWIRHPSMMFPHEDVEGKIIGAKFRQIPDSNGEYDGPRFMLRGRLGLYILHAHSDKHFEKSKTYLVESETSANSLWSFLLDNGKKATVLSFGGVNSPPERLPDNLDDNDIRLVIDYDGDEELFQQRIKLYSHLNVKPIKMILPKGEDINSLYHKGEMWKVEHLLFN